MFPTIVSCSYPWCICYLKFVSFNFWLKTLREVKMVRYWPSSFCVFMEGDRVEVHKLAKKGTKPISSILTQ